MHELLIRCARARRAVYRCVEKIDEILPLVEEEENEDGRHHEHDHQEEVEYFGHLLRPQPSLESLDALLTATGEATACASCYKSTHSG